MQDINATRGWVTEDANSEDLRLIQLQQQRLGLRHWTCCVNGYLKKPRKVCCTGKTVNMEGKWLQELPPQRKG